MRRTRGTCAWLLVRFAGWLNTLDGRIFCLIILRIYFVVSDNDVWRPFIKCDLLTFRTLGSENEKYESLFCVCFCSFLSSCYLCKAMMNDEPYLEPLIKLNKTTLVPVHACTNTFLKSSGFNTSQSLFIQQTEGASVECFNFIVLWQLKSHLSSRLIAHYGCEAVENWKLLTSAIPAAAAWPGLSVPFTI